MNVEPAGQAGGGRACEDSCLVARLSRYGALSEAEAARVARLEGDPRELRAGASIIRAGQETDQIFVIQSGWAVMRTRGVSGRSSVVHVYLPGDIVGLAEIGVRPAAQDVAMQTEGVICPFPRVDISHIYTQLPRLAALLTSLGCVETVALRDRMTTVTTSPARARLAFFLCDLHRRLEMAMPGLGRRFRMPLRQADIAEALGLTPVYVNKLLRQLTEEGLIQVERPYVRLLDAPGLRAMGGYVDRWSTLDTSWLPEDGSLSPDRRIAGAVGGA
ncbi:MAG: Crp/Fnr family transcriptional regulator [Paracoccaceae bacterium]